MAESQPFFGAVRRFFRDYLAAIDTRRPFGRLMRQASEDAALRKRLVDQPKQVLAEAGVELPEGLEVEVFENTGTVIHLVLPPLAEPAKSAGGEA